MSYVPRAKVVLTENVPVADAVVPRLCNAVDPPGFRIWTPTGRPVGAGINPWKMTIPETGLCASAIEIFPGLTSKKSPEVASTKILAVDVAMFGTEIVCVPSLGVFASKRLDPPEK
jgi:hypothetical protein